MLGKWGRVDLSNLDHLKKVAIHLYDPLDSWEMIQSLPLHRIELLFVVHPNLLDRDLEKSRKYSEKWEVLDGFLKSHNLGRSEDDPLPFYVVSDCGYNAAHKGCKTVLPEFTKREVVYVDPSLLHHLHYRGAFDRLQGYPAGVQQN